MNRRAKLSLVPNKGVVKKQAAGFEVAAAESGQGQADTPPAAARVKAPDGAEAAPGRTKAPPGRAGALPRTVEAASARGDKAPSVAPSPWPSGRQLLKVAAVVVVAALSLFLLKRRII